MHPVLRISSFLLPLLILEALTASPGQESNRTPLPLPTAPDFTWDANAWEKGSGANFWREGTKPSKITGSRPATAVPARKKNTDTGKATLSPTSRQSEK